MSHRVATISTEWEEMKLKIRGGSEPTAVEAAIRARFNIPAGVSIALVDKQGREVKVQNLETAEYSLRVGAAFGVASGGGASGVSEFPLIFAINGQRFEIPARDVDPNMALVEFIRYHTDFKGTKIGCGEGGCGACTVNVARFDASSGKVLYAPATSCLIPLAAVDGWAITTTEGIGGSQQPKGFHAVQERIAQWNGNQCGFCTPGMVMSTYSALKESQAEGFSLNGADMEFKLDGNLCRCTGYRPILQAVKSLLPEGKEIEDHLTHAEKRVKAYDPRDDPQFPAFLKSHRANPLRFSANGLTWLRCTELNHVFTALEQSRGMAGLRFVVANTSKGVYKEDTDRILIDVECSRTTTSC
jgi:aerobic-type carbon monoxide dehydrogenase small subunit (CoxS/CutS family)